MCFLEAVTSAWPVPVPGAAGVGRTQMTGFKVTVLPYYLPLLFVFERDIISAMDLKRSADADEDAQSTSGDFRRRNPRLNELKPLLKLCF